MLAVPAQSDEVYLSFYSVVNIICICLVVIIIKLKHTDFVHEKPSCQALQVAVGDPCEGCLTLSYCACFTDEAFEIGFKCCTVETSFKSCTVETSFKCCTVETSFKCCTLDP